MVIENDHKGNGFIGCMLRVYRILLRIAKERCKREQGVYNGELRNKLSGIRFKRYTSEIIV